MARYHGHRSRLNPSSAYLALVVVALVGCAATPVPPASEKADGHSASTPVEREVNPSLQPSVRDFTGLVRSFRKVALDPSIRFDVIDIEVINGGGSPFLLDVAFAALPCERRPVIEVHTDREGLTISVYRGPREPEVCDAIAIISAIRLEVTTSVPADAVKARVTDGLPPE